jgi:hypothetical protein
VKVSAGLLFAAALGCASAPAARTPTAAAGGSTALDAMMRSDLADDHAIAWSARRLTWDDFQGSPPTEGSEGAMTSYTLYSAWKCRGGVFEFRVIAGFRPRQSWVKPIILNDAIQRRTILGHEQTHFDLAEVYARAMRQALGEVVNPCRMTDTHLSAIAQRLAQAEKVEQSRYDAETKHGLLASQQAAWSAAVARRLMR